MPSSSSNSSYGGGSKVPTSFMGSMQPKSRLSAPSKGQRNSYGMIAQTDVGACETYASNMDQQALNRDDNLEERLEKFFHAQAPHYKSRIPIIMDAYREWPMLLFGDLDHNYGTDFSRPVEKDVWNNEAIDRKRIRVQVAQDYIYRAMNKQDYMHPRELTKYTQAKQGTSKPRISTNQSSSKKAAPKSRKRRAARKVVEGASKVAGSIGSGASKMRRSVGRVSLTRKHRLSAPKVVKVQNRP